MNLIYYNLKWLLIFIALTLLVAFIITPEEPEPLPDLHTMASEMVMIGLNIQDLRQRPQKIYKTLKEYPFTGVILYDSSTGINSRKADNYQPDDLQKLITDLKLNLPDGSLIAIDQEGGYVQRLHKRNGFTDYPSAYKLGISQEPRDVTDISRQLAEELKGLGINLNLAPVVDLNNFKNPVIGRLKRSFSSDPEKVYKYALAFIRGHQKADVYCCIKHFPGHGSSTRDTHKGFADVTEVYSPRELQPFSRLARKVDFVMTSHTYNKEFDIIWPASLSQKTINILRNDLKFDGVIITDDLLMGAIMNMRSAGNKRLSFEEIVIQAVKAGNDILLFSDNFHSRNHYGQKAVEIIKNRVKSGQLSKETVVESYRRIKKAKKRLLT